MKKNENESLAKEWLSAIVTDFLGIPGRNTLRLTFKALGKATAAIAKSFENSGCLLLALMLYLIGGFFYILMISNFTSSIAIVVALLVALAYFGFNKESRPSSYHPRCPECIYFDDCKGGANFDIFKSKIFTLAKNPNFTEFLTKVPCTNQRIAEEPPPLPPPPPPLPPSNSIYHHPRCPECIYFNICKGGVFAYLLPFDLNVSITAETQQEAVAELLKLVPCANIKSIKSDV